MKVTYDPEVDVLYILLREGVTATRAVKIEVGVSADMDADGHIVGLELLDAKQRLGAVPASVALEWLTSETLQASA